MNSSNSPALFSKKKFLKESDLAVLKSSSLPSIRINMHESLAADLHSMIIKLSKTDDKKIHKHPHKSEVITILEGKGVISLYNQNKEVIETSEIGPLSSGDAFSLYIPKNQWHSIEVTSETLIVNESTLGPFNKKSTIYLNEPL